MNTSYQMNRNNMSQFDRLNRISDKLNNVKIKNIILKTKILQTSITPKNSKFEFLTSRVADLNEHLDEIMDQTTKKFNIIKENVINIFNLYR